MEQVNEAQPQSQPPSQRFYALEQLGELAGTITLISEGLQAYRAQVAGLLAGQKKAEAFELYRLLERQRTYLVEQIRATRPFLMELENPLAPAAQKLAEQLAAFPLMTADYSKLTEVLKRFADALPDHQTTDASIIGRLMNNVRLGHYDTPYPHFPIPRLVFGFSLNQEGKASHCRIGVVADEIPTPETPMYYYPFSNVSRESGSLCVGANTLPIYKKPHKAHNLPAFLLSIPNNMHYYSSSNNKLGLEYRELMEHLKDKDPEYYYSDILIPKKETLGEFIQRA